MALTLAAEQRLASVELIEFFEDDRAKWYAIAVETYAHVKKSWQGAVVRPDDVAAFLVPTLEIREDLTMFLNAKKLTQKYWRRWFCDLILDRCWDELTKDG